ncbi:MAG: ribosome maturation factor RimM [Thermodesulfobacteriota bacterium]
MPIGRVIKPHGVRGKIKLEYYGEDARHFPSSREVFIEVKAGDLRPYEILNTAPQPPWLLIHLKGIDKREDVESLIGKEVFIKRESLPALEAGEYYWIDLLGISVETPEGKKLGRVKEIFSTGANDVYVVEGKRGEIFLPATEEVIESVDLKMGVMKVNRKEGLWEAEDEV